MKIVENLREIIAASGEFVEEIIISMQAQDKQFSMIEDSTVLGLYLASIEKADSLLFLVENNKFAGIETLLRAIFEASSLMQFVLKSDTQNRTKAYALSVKLKLLKMIETSLGTNDKGSKIREHTGMTREELLRVYDNITDKAELMEEFKNITGKQSADKWYMVESSVSSFEKLCEYLGDRTIVEYEIIYRILSNDTHGKNALDYFKINNGNLHIMNSTLDPMILPMLRGIILSNGKLVSEYYGLEEHYIRTFGEIVSNR